MKKILLPLIAASAVAPLVSTASCSSIKVYELELDQFHSRNYIIENLTIQPHETVMFKTVLTLIEGSGSAVHFFDKNQTAFVNKNISISIERKGKKSDYSYRGVPGTAPQYSYEIIDYKPQSGDIIYITYACDDLKTDWGLSLSTK